MENILYDKLLDLYMLDFSTEERARFLLKAIEEAGMLPPNVKVTREIYGNNKGDIELLKDIVSYDYEICWEPEDE